MDLKRVHQILSESFTKTIKEYKDIYKLLDPLVKQYFETHYEEWQRFGSWDFSENGKHIIVNYSYLEYDGEWEWGQDNILIDKVIEMIEV